MSSLQRRTRRSGFGSFGLLVLCAAFFSLGLMGLSGCEKKDGNSTANVGGGVAPAVSLTQADLVARGKRVYMSTCTACHNMDPKKAGSLGPEVAGSSKELLEARIMRAEYPEGYKPKRNTKLMAAMPQLKNDLDALTAYLQALK